LKIASKEEETMIRNETDLALEYLKEQGHEVGQVHMPPPQFGDALRVWVDGKSLSFEEVRELAATERASKNNVRV
jgi:hypothetical protein